MAGVAGVNARREGAHIARAACNIDVVHNDVACEGAALFQRQTKIRAADGADVERLVDVRSIHHKPARSGHVDVRAVAKGPVIPGVHETVVDVGVPAVFLRSLNKQGGGSSFDEVRRIADRGVQIHVSVVTVRATVGIGGIRRVVEGPDAIEAEVGLLAIHVQVATVDGTADVQVPVRVQRVATHIFNPDV